MENYACSMQCIHLYLAFFLYNFFTCITYFDMFIFYVTCQGAEKVEAIVVTFQNESTSLNFEALSNMKRLRLLMILGSFGIPKSGSLTPKLDYLSNNLRLLEWNRFPFKEFPPTFRPDKLVKLKLTKSNLVRLFWNKHIKVHIC